MNRAAAGAGPSWRSLRAAIALAQGAVVAIAVAHVLALTAVFAVRLVYPLDLEWMEGGMLVHAFRLARGLPIYGPPSVDIISYLYTPLYPAILAALSHLFGLGYALGRAVSVLSFAWAALLAYLAVRRETGLRVLPLAAVALLCGAYPSLGQWYDLVRNDSLFLALAASAVYLARYHGDDLRGVLAAGLFAALAFLAKQTGSFFAVGVGLALVTSVGLRRRTFYYPYVYGLLALAVASGFVWAMDRQTHGWCWTYIFRIHQRHDFNYDRLWKAQKDIFHALPLVHAGTAAALVWGCVERWRRRTGATLFWAFFALVGLAISSVAYGTQWSGENVYIPGVYFGVIAACVVLGRLAALAPAGLARRAAVACAGIACAWQLAHQIYDPRRMAPGPNELATADRFLARLRAVEGSLLVPFHPFYPALVGRAPHFHHMGINDVTRAGMPVPADIVRGVTTGRWDAILLDREPDPRYGDLSAHYKLAEDLADIHAAPATITGWIVAPRFLYVRKRQEPAQPGAAARFDSERMR